jgi:hypothetical protein
MLSTEDSELPDEGRAAPETRAAGTPPGTGQIADEVLDRAHGFPSPEPNRHGRARAMTVFSPVKPFLRWPPGGVLWLQGVFGVAKVRPGRNSPLRKLSFIHFARWLIVRSVPDHGQPPEDLRQPLLMFESNYNGTFDQYIDAFSEILTTGMKLIWANSYGFPGPKPVTPFKTYIRANEFVAQHYYSAYPTATTTMIVSALELMAPHEAFRERARNLTAAEFGDAYGSFLTEMQEHL